VKKLRGPPKRRKLRNGKCATGKGLGNEASEKKECKLSKGTETGESVERSHGEQANRRRGGNVWDRLRGGKARNPPRDTYQKKKSGKKPRGVWGSKSGRANPRLCTGIFKATTKGAK